MARGEFCDWAKSQMSNDVERGPLDSQVGGKHYKSMKIGPAEFIHLNKIGYLEGNCIKYVCRHAAKGGAQDIRKAIHYLRILLKVEYGSDD
jgi:hypothetical protein